MDEAFGANGSDCSEDLEWIRRTVVMDSSENDVSMLVDDDIDDI